MRFAGDLFSAFRPGGEAIMGADREARGFIKKNPWTLGGVGYGLKTPSFAFTWINTFKKS